MTCYITEAWWMPERCQDLDRYPFNVPAVRSMVPLALDVPVTLFVGENGTGKSSVLEGIAGALGNGSGGGSRNLLLEVPKGQSRLAPALRLVRTAARPADQYFHRADTVMYVASEVEELGVTGYGPRSLLEQSHGQLSLALLTNRFRGRGIYLMDEPEAGLSVRAQLSALWRIHELASNGSQFIIATHSPILMNYPGARIHEFTERGIETRTLEELEQVSLARDFLTKPDRYLGKLLHADDS